MWEWLSAEGGGATRGLDLGAVGGGEARGEEVKECCIGNTCSLSHDEQWPPHLISCI